MRTPNMTGTCILIVEDESAIREMIAIALSRERYEVMEAADADAAMSRISERCPDLILLDWMLPGQSGLGLARRLRRDDYTREIPLIMLTARVDEEDKVQGLEAGADDYITKPFSPRELSARIRALLRRSRPQAADAPVKVADLTLDPAGYRVSVNDSEVAVGPTEFKLLHFFMTHPE